MASADLSINKIRSNLVFGGARPTLFQVIFTNPINSIADSIAPFMIKNASIPQDHIGQIMIPYMGRQYPIPGDRVFDPWTVTIINDENFKIRDALEQWMGNINSHRGNLALKGSAPSNYVSQATVSQLARDGSTLRTYQFNNIFPTNLGNIDLSWDAVDTIEEYTVDFAYEDWKIVGGNTGDAGGTTADGELGLPAA